jgi:hypothetical protein
MAFDQLELKFTWIPTGHTLIATLLPAPRTLPFKHNCGEQGMKLSRLGHVGQFDRSSRNNPRALPHGTFPDVGVVAVSTSHHLRLAHLSPSPSTPFFLSRQ